MDHKVFSRAGDPQAPAVTRSFFSKKPKASGRFDLTSVPTRRSGDMARALTTGILVLYPVLASAAVVVAGFLLAGAHA